MSRRVPELDARRLYRCTGCGSWRYRMNRSCPTCERIARRYYLQRETGK